MYKRLLPLMAGLFFVLPLIQAQNVNLTFFLKDKDGKALTSTTVDIRIVFKSDSDTLVDQVYNKTTDDFVGAVNENLKDELSGQTLDPMTDYYACYSFVHEGDTIRSDRIPVHKAAQSVTSEHAATADHAITSDVAQNAEVASSAMTAISAQNALTADNAINADNAMMALNATNWTPVNIPDEGSYSVSVDAEGKVSIGDMAFTTPNEEGVFGSFIIDESRGGILTKLDMPVAGIRLAPDDVVESFGVEILEIPIDELTTMVNDVNSNPTAVNLRGLAGRRYKDPNTKVTSQVCYDPQIKRVFTRPMINRQVPVWFFNNNEYCRQGSATTRWKYPGVFKVSGDASTGTINFSDGFNNYSFMGDEFVCARDFFTVSDLRLKTNIHGVDGVLDRVMQLQPKVYQFENREATSDHWETGFIAQEVEEIFPDMVVDVNFDALESSSIEGTKKVVKYNNMIPVLTKAIQEQQSIIQDQQRQIDELKALVKQMADEK